MNFEEYVSLLPEKISKVKLLILKTLWEAGHEFPRNWVRSSTLLTLTKQKYFDRRARELRDEAGCDVESEYYNGEHCWRLKSNKIKKSNPRFYLTESQKIDLFEQYEYTCQVCGKKTTEGVRGLQADHKIPLIREKILDSKNWQPLCNECNVAKRRACADCEEDCKKCPWAFPETVGLVTLVRLPSNIFNKLKQCGCNQPTEIEKFILTALEHYLLEK